MYEVNPPVERIYLIGPQAVGKRLAQRLYPLCRECRWIPAFFIADRLTEDIRRQLRERLMRTGVITFGPDSEAVYRQFYGKGKMTKILRLLEPGEPKPEFFFSYQAQIFPWPEKQKDYRIILAWMGIVLFGKWNAYRRHDEEAAPEAEFQQTENHQEYRLKKEVIT